MTVVTIDIKDKLEEEKVMDKFSEFCLNNFESYSLNVTGKKQSLTEVKKE